MLSKVLIANRGEIAVRVIRACRDLGIVSVAVYSEADADALHVRLADEAWPCGPAEAAASYLDAEQLVQIAQRSGADAVHPGYGFLSENGDFADAVAAAGLVWIGPRGDVIRCMGDKVTSRQTMAAAGVPVVPGTNERLSDEALATRAAQIGFPVMVKASAGGGGRGLRRVDRADALEKAVAMARVEARAAFGDDGLYLEQWIESPRHIEVQVLADGHGKVVHLFERECSIQRRHQKLLEEAPATGLSDAQRDELGAAAVSAARAVGYEGAGTVEFLLGADGRCHFLEMNTRIQVEHPVTEAITGVDLVAAQLRIASGEPLPFTQQDLQIRGHAIEARITAEDPDKRFLPSPGAIAVWSAPDGPGIRVDTGVGAGSEVTPHYDSLVAKLVVWGRDRDEAIARLDRALAEFQVVGIRTPIPFHRRILAHPAFRAGAYDTGFIEAHLSEPEPPEVHEHERRIAFALAAWAAAQTSDASSFDILCGKDARRVDLSCREPVRASVAGDRVELELRVGPGMELRVRTQHASLPAAVVAAKPGRYDVVVAGCAFTLAVDLGG